MVHGLGCMVQGLGFIVQGSELMVYSSGFPPAHRPGGSQPETLPVPSQLVA